MAFFQVFFWGGTHRGSKSRGMVEAVVPKHEVVRSVRRVGWGHSGSTGLAVEGLSPWLPPWRSRGAWGGWRLPLGLTWGSPWGHTRGRRTSTLSHSRAMTPGPEPPPTDPCPPCRGVGARARGAERDVPGPRPRAPHVPRLRERQRQDQPRPPVLPPSGLRQGRCRNTCSMGLDLEREGLESTL